MKKLFLILVILALLAAGAVVWFLSNRGVTDGADLLPADTIAFAAIPDLPRSRTRWSETALAKIAADPQVKAFLAKPMESLGAGGGGEASEILDKLKPTKFFLALTAVSESSADLVLGFQFDGGRDDLDAAINRLHAELAKHVHGGETSAVDYKGDKVTKFGAAESSLYSAAHKNWALLSTSEAALQAALDRATGRDTSASFAGSELLAAVRKQLSPNPDFEWFAKPGPLLDMLLSIGQQQGAVVDDSQLAEARKIKAAGGTLLFEGAEQKERTFVQMDGMPELPDIDHGMMALTEPGSTAFFESVLDLETMASESYIASLPEPVQAFLSANGLAGGDLKNILGGELGVVIKWAPGAFIPSVLAAVTIKDRDRAEAIAAKAFEDAGLQMTVSESSGAKIYAFPPMGALSLIDPAVAINEKFVIASLTANDITKALSNKGETLETSTVFASAKTAFDAKNQAFGFIDAKGIFERVYNQLQPMLVLAASMSADASQGVDLDKLPETAAISQHLTPIVYTNEQVDGGWLIESHGPITFSQAAVLVGAGVGAAWASQAAAGFAQ